ncbi:hypothetical protein BGI03_00455 [Snodgrassella alvi]|nr:hypothetical protein BGH98_01905 [Snodgrassella alvi]ORF10673.1 hypothetical protein BGI01_10185 [Snodgrassella alvi]ORF22228.1 hypothetical protein BGI03_00455 [Snodgrassella alvi]ORF22375.1 hypothetical protein BGI04_01025 [Snodgrassella alvi]
MQINHRNTDKSANQCNLIATINLYLTGYSNRNTDKLPTLSWKYHFAVQILFVDNFIRPVLKSLCTIFFNSVKNNQQL